MVAAHSNTSQLDHNALQLGVYSSALACVSTLLSGPLGLAVVLLVQPQPAWLDAQTFAAHYHPIQVLPYVFGFGLITGFVALIVSAHTLTPPSERARSGLAVAWATVFAALIGLNYILQTTLVPALARQSAEANAAIIGALSMSSPGSLGWALEMHGYAWFGLATWSIAPFFRAGHLETATRWLFVLNGPVSVSGAALAVAAPGWETTRAGLAAFFVWNLLALLMAAGALVSFHGRRRRLAL